MFIQECWSENSLVADEAVMMLQLWRNMYNRESVAHLESTNCRFCHIFLQEDGSVRSPPTTSQHHDGQVEEHQTDKRTGYQDDHNEH